MGANFFGEAGTKAAVARLMKGIIFWCRFDSKIADLHNCINLNRIF